LFKKGRSPLPFLGGVGRKEHSSLFSPIFKLLIKAHRSLLKQFSYKRRLTIRRALLGAHNTTSIQPLVGNLAQASNLLYFRGSRYDELLPTVLTIRRAFYLWSETQHELATDYTSELTIRRALLQPKRNWLIISGSLYDNIMSSLA
jgi:hypothetical protein